MGPVEKIGPILDINDLKMGLKIEIILGHLMVWLVARIGSEIDQPSGLGNGG